VALFFNAGKPTKFKLVLSIILLFKDIGNIAFYISIDKQEVNKQIKLGYVNFTAEYIKRFLNII